MCRKWCCCRNDSFSLFLSMTEMCDDSSPAYPPNKKEEDISHFLASYSYSIPSKTNEFSFPSLLTSSSRKKYNHSFTTLLTASSSTIPPCAFAHFVHFNPVPEVPSSQCRLPDREKTSTVESSAIAISPLMLPSSSSLKEMTHLTDSGNCDAAALAKRRKYPLSAETDFADYDCESEETARVFEEPSKPVLARSGTKRSRAAEVHNLSEKRRRSKINEKMKALQNLIPNSNKTDKASMLDEAIDYLKQLQLQVQMLSMRNGLTLHSMFLPGALQPLQVPQMHMSFSAGNGSVPMHMGMNMLPMNQESLKPSSFGPSNQCSSSHQPILLSGISNITSSVTSFGLDSSHTGQEPFELSLGAEGVIGEGILRQQQLNVSHPLGNLSENEVEPMAASLSLDGQASIMDETGGLQARMLLREKSHLSFPRDTDNQFTDGKKHGES